MELAVVLAGLAFVAVVIIVILYLSVRVVQQYEQMVVFRLGKTNEAMVRGPGLPTRRWKLQAREWKAEREFKRRSKHLKVVDKDGKDDPPRWMN